MRGWISATLITLVAVGLTGCFFERKPAAAPTAGPIRFTTSEDVFDITYDIPKNCVVMGESLPIIVSIQGKSNQATITHLNVDITNDAYTQSLIPPDVIIPSTLTMNDPPFIISTTWEHTNYQSSSTFYGAYIRIEIDYLDQRSKNQEASRYVYLGVDRLSYKSDYEAELLNLSVPCDQMR